MLESSVNATRLYRSQAAKLVKRGSTQSRLGTILAASAAALAAAAVYNTYRTRKVEHDHPPAGQFVTVDGVRLHYLEKGEGPPVVLIHGNVVTAEDYVWSGVFDRVARNHRVITIDRPGFGYSDRPQGSLWTAAHQADLLAQALDRLDIDQAVVVGHSWGTLVALELALRFPDAVSGLVLLAGYYGPSVRADVPLVAPPAIPGIGDVLRYTVSPLLGAALLPLNLKAMFAPLEVPERFSRDFPHGFPVRPSQIRAESQAPSPWCRAGAGWGGRGGDWIIPERILAGPKDRFWAPKAKAKGFPDKSPGRDPRRGP